MALVSDDLSRLEPERAAFIPLALPPLGESAIPFGPSVDGAPTRLQLAVERPWETWLVASIFNWHDTPQALTFDPSEWDIAGPDPYHLFDFWAGEHIGPNSGPFTFEPTPAHGVRQLIVHADLGRPQLVGSTLHLLGGAVELADETWADNTLRLTLDCPGEHEGSLLIYMPEGYEYRRGGTEGTIRKGRILTVPLRLSDPVTITLEFEGPAWR
jgi:hypothetical protein